MTLEEFKQKIEGVSDRRLLRMLERAQADGLQAAIALIEGERVKRAEIATQVAAAELTSQIRPLEEVLGRGFGQPVSIPKVEAPRAAAPVAKALAPQPQAAQATVKPNPIKVAEPEPVSVTVMPSDSREALADALFAQSPFAAMQAGEVSEPKPVEALPELSAASAGGKTEREPEDLMPLTLTAKDWGSFSAPEATSDEENAQAANGHAHPQRGWVIFAIILLMLAGFFAIWRALVG